MKGKSIIELRNVHTGEVERHIDHNLVTNGIKVFPGTAIWGKTELTEDKYFPLWKNWFSGLRLFENTLEEDPDNYIYKYSEPITGYASNTADTTDPKRGLFNISESGPLEDNSGVRLVWDFAQNQANGQISCISIAPNVFARPDILDTMYYPLGNKSYFFDKLSDGTNMASTPNRNTILLDYDKNKRIATFATNIWEVPGKFKLIRCLLEPVLYSPLAARDLNILDEHDIETPITGSSTQIQFLMTNTEFYMAIALKGTTDAEETFYLLKISKNDFTLTTEEFSIPSIEGSQYGTPSMGVSFEYAGYLYVICRNRSFKVRFTDTNDIVALDHLSIASLVTNEEIIGNGYVIDSNGKYQLINSGVSWKINISYNSFNNAEVYYPAFIEVIKGIYILIGSNKYSKNDEAKYGLSIFADTRLLYTINNLATPVIKTADKTMKITYILTNE